MSIEPFASGPLEMEFTLTSHDRKFLISMAPYGGGGYTAKLRCEDCQPFVIAGAAVSEWTTHPFPDRDGAVEEAKRIASSAAVPKGFRK